MIGDVMDVRRLTVLQELSRHGTVNAAAAALHLTPSAVSQQLAALAREVGCEITEKDGRNLRITSAGKLLLAHAEEITAQLETLKSDLQRHHLGEVGTVRIGAFQTAAKHIVVPAAATLAVTHPKLEVNLTQVDAPKSLDELAWGRIDVALSVEYIDSPPTTDPRFGRIPLLVDEFDVLLPADHRLAPTARVALSDLRDEQWIGNIAGSPCHFVTMAACASAGFAPKLRHQVDDWAILVELVAAGLGVGFVPGLAQPPVRPDVVARPLKGRPAARNIVGFTRRGTEESPTIGRVLAALTETAKGYEARGRTS